MSVLSGSEASFVSSVIKRSANSGQYVWIGLHDPTPVRYHLLPSNLSLIEFVSWPILCVSMRKDPIIHIAPTLESSWDKKKSLDSAEAPSLHDIQLAIVSFYKILK